MANTTRREAAERAIRKAVELPPPVLKLDEGFYAVGSSREGHGYLLEVNGDGDLYCPCKGAQINGCCFHRAALGLFLGTIPQSWIPVVDMPVELAVAS